MLKTSKPYSFGFTLIEVLVVIAIIGILVGIVFEAGNAAKKQARDNQRVTDIKNLQLKLGAYKDLNGVYPAKLSQLNLSQMPVDPLTGSQYLYSGLAFSADSTKTCVTYHIGADLETNSAQLAQKAGQTQNGGNLPSPYNFQSCIDQTPVTPVTADADFDGTATIANRYGRYDAVSPDLIKK